MHCFEELFVYFFEETGVGTVHLFLFPSLVDRRGDYRTVLSRRQFFLPLSPSKLTFELSSLLTRNTTPPPPPQHLDRFRN